MSTETLSFPEPPIGGLASATAENTEQANEDRPPATASSDNPNTITAPANPDGLAPRTAQGPSEVLHTNTRPRNIGRKESSVAFSKAGGVSDRDRESRVGPEPVVEGGEDGGEEDDDGAAVNHEERAPRPMLGRKGTSDNPSMLTTSSAVTVSETPYVDMLLALDRIGPIHNLLAFAFCWLLLAGFVVLPGTMQKTLPQKADLTNNKTVRAVIKWVVALPLFVPSSSSILGFSYSPFRLYIRIAVAGVVSSTGLIGMVWMWIRWRRNYIWLIRNIFL